MTDGHCSEIIINWLAEFGVVVVDRCTFFRGGRYNKFDCTLKSTYFEQIFRLSKSKEIAGKVVKAVDKIVW